MILEHLQQKGDAIAFIFSSGRINYIQELPVNQRLTE
jgi:hypothetical protein